MSFLAPLFLLGALGLAAPILYHLIRRTTRERKVFSSLMFLVPSPPRISKRHRFEHLLLLLLRCLALALLVFGFARPYLPQTEFNDPTATQPKRILVLVDVSASMRRDGVWPAALERVETVLRGATPVDQVAVYTFDRQATALLSFEDWTQAPAGGRVALATGRLQAVAPGWRGTHLGTALVTAAETLGENGGDLAPGPRQVFVVSDFQAGSRLDALQAYEWPQGIELFVETVPAGNPDNAGLQSVAGVDSADAAAAAAVRVRVTNSRDAKNERFKVGWTGGTPGAGFAGASIDAYVPPGQGRVFVVPLPEGASGLERIVLQGDEEDFDNAVHVIPPTQQRATVLWLGNEDPDDPAQPLFFLRRALADTPRLAVEVLARPASGPPPTTAELTAASLVFVADPLAPAALTALREQAGAGQRVVVVLKSPAMAATLGALFDRAAPALEEARLDRYAMLTEIDFQHPLFAPFADPRFSDFTKIHVWKYRRLAAGEIPESRVPAKFDNGDPALLEAPFGRGRIYVFTTGWQPEDSQLAVSSKFVPLVWSLLELGGAVAPAPAQFFVGDAIPVPESGATAVLLPDGTTVPLAPGAAEFSAAAEPGIYAFTGGARTVRFAVNVDASESRTEPLGGDELEHLGLPVTPESAVAALPVEDKTTLEGAAAENRQKLWRWFIVATLAVLLLETAVAGWTARRTEIKSVEVAS